MPKKTCGSPTTTYGAPTGDKEFNVIRVSRLSFNDRTKSFEFEVELELLADPSEHPRLLADVGGDELVSAIPDRPVVLPP